MPYSDSLSLRIRAYSHLTSPATVTRRFIMQKARSHHIKMAPTACRRTVSGSISLLCSRCFSPFPHGTGSLSVSREYLALRDGPRRFTQDFSCPALLRIPLRFGNHPCKGLSPATAALSRDVPLGCCLAMSWSYNPVTASTATVWAPPLSLATTRGIICYFLLLWVLRCFSSPRSPRQSR